MEFCFRATSIKIVIGVVILVASCFGSTANAQNTGLLKELHESLTKVSGSDQITILNKLAWEMRSVYPDSAIYFANKALVLAKQHGVSRVAESENYVGLAYYYQGSFTTAFEWYEKALATAITTSDSLQTGYAYNNIGRLFSEQEMLDESFPYFVKAESTFRGTGEKSGLAYVYQSFGNLYKSQGDFVKAERNYQNALTIRKEIGNTRDIMSAMVLLGKLYMEVDRPGDAVLYLKKVDSAGHVINDALALAEVKILTGEYYLSLNEIDKAEAMCSEGLQYILGFSNVKLLPRAYIVLGRIWVEKKDYNRAKASFSSGLSMASKMKSQDLQMQAHYQLWKLSDLMGQREQGLFHSNQYLTLKDSLTGIDISGKVAQFQFQLEIERKRQENELLKSREKENLATIHQQGFQRILLSSLLLFISGLFYIQWRHARRRKMANVALRIQKRQIEQQAEEINTQLLLVAEKHEEVLKQKDEIARINSLLTEKLDEISHRNTVLESHVTTLLAFSKSKSINFGSIEDALMDIAKLTATTLQVNRVGIWNYSDQEKCIQSVAIYDLQSDKFLENSKIDLGRYPNYGRALRSKKVINAPDARIDEDTKEFLQSYLEPLDIHSMLDVMYEVGDGHIAGLVCCEQQGEARAWKPEDVIFTTSVSDMISLTYRTSQRRDYEKRLRQQSKEISRMNEMLEQRVKERTMELESQNQQLSEYAFINSHLLRSPVAKIIGLLNIAELDDKANHKQIMGYLKNACEELDAIVKKITIALDGGGPFDRTAIDPKKDAPIPGSSK